MFTAEGGGVEGERETVGITSDPGGLWRVVVVVVKAAGVEFIIPLPSSRVRGGCFVGPLSILGLLSLSFRAGFLPSTTTVGGGALALAAGSAPASSNSNPHASPSLLAEEAGAWPSFRVVAGVGA